MNARELGRQAAVLHLKLAGLDATPGTVAAEPAGLKAPPSPTGGAAVAGNFGAKPAVSPIASGYQSSAENRSAKRGAAKDLPRISAANYPVRGWNGISSAQPDRFTGIDGRWRDQRNARWVGRSVDSADAGQHPRQSSAPEHYQAVDGDWWFTLTDRRGRHGAARWQ